MPYSKVEYPKIRKNLSFDYFIIIFKNIKNVVGTHSQQRKW